MVHKRQPKMNAQCQLCTNKKQSVSYSIHSFDGQVCAHDAPAFAQIYFDSPIDWKKIKNQKIYTPISVVRKKMI